jgi:solute carrier family 25 (mitochondrial citrate transporter), member 1
MNSMINKKHEKLKFGFLSIYSYLFIKVNYREMSSSIKDKKQLSLPQHFFAGGVAGVVEAMTCHPLDTIKVNMQLKRGQRINPFKASAMIIKNDGFLGFYRGLGAVVIGISPKMAIRFSSFEASKSKLHPYINNETARNFTAGLIAGTIETILIVNPMEVVKIRLQSDKSLSNVFQASGRIFSEEGIRGFYRGLVLTISRQAINQAVNFSIYHRIKGFLSGNDKQKELASYKHFLIGAFSGSIGPISNAPIDTLKTRIQASRDPGISIFGLAKQIYINEGFLAFFKGITPRLLRIAPGQAVTFMVYEKVSAWITNKQSVSYNKAL